MYHEAAIASSVLGTAISGAGAVYQGRMAQQNAQYQAQLAEYNAKVSENNAIMQKQAADADADTIDRRRKISLAQGQVSYAKSGVVINEGTTLDVLGGMAAEFELDRLNRLHQGEVQSRASMIGAQQDRANAGGLLAQGNAAMTAGLISGAGTLAAGAGRIGMSMSMTTAKQPNLPLLAQQGYYTPF